MHSPVFERQLQELLGLLVFPGLLSCLAKEIWFTCKISRLHSAALFIVWQKPVLALCFSKYKAFPHVVLVVVNPKRSCTHTSSVQLAWFPSNILYKRALDNGLCPWDVNAEIRCHLGLCHSTEISRTTVLNIICIAQSPINYFETQACRRMNHVGKPKKKSRSSGINKIRVVIVNTTVITKYTTTMPIFSSQSERPRNGACLTGKGTA